ncbi:hypothetical protein M7775_19105 [Sporomusa sphaeroides DSM 2875]|uniref:hypothetical protein n=1 Tax=Sporomusa sphaeroides TaxID=47679 RepID=UPI00202FBA45|nr:hypothetical protein [Sporomusa sphaeroides]MCM0760662.1 hypothetical protein [Sporomusa sphaeroides DSM 2875]
MALLFPITQRPIVGWSDGRPDNLLIVSQQDAGYKVTRPRFTRPINKLGPFVWQYLNEVQKEQLMTFYDETTGFGSLPFNFTYYTRAGSHTVNVRFDGAPKCQYVGYGKWLVTCSFEEV